MIDAHVQTDIYDANSVPALWAAARWFFRHLSSICGAPCDLVAEAFLSRKERREISRWLRPIEGLARRLLIAEAARIAQNPETKRRTGTKTGKNVPK